MDTAVKVWTDEELMALPKNGHKHELINWEIIMSPTGYRHEDIAAAVLTAMRLHVCQHKLGSVWVINPEEKSALVYRGAAAGRLLRVTDALDGEDVLPGFRLPLAELFAELSFG